jgi:long-chain fatty acid transport protein
LASVTALYALTVLAPTAAHGAAFSIFEQGSKAMGMAGAFTAQADDPSLLFHNAGGLAFVDEAQLTTGFTWIHVNGTQFKGLGPFPGVGVEEQMKDLDVPAPHAYYVRPLAGNWRFGVGFNSPFGLSTEWENPDSFSGRFISQRADLKTFDINPTLGVQITPKLGFGFGIIGRFSKVELERHVPSINPFTGGVIDIASIDLKSDLNSGFGWNVGLLHRVGTAISWGLSYRSNVTVDYGGDAQFTQILTGNAQLDAVIATRLPFNQKLGVETSIEFPDTASLGVAVQLTDRLLTEVDVNWTGWSSFDELPLTFTTVPALSDIIPENYNDTYHYRLGFKFESGSGAEWRFGYAYDETPLPDESVGPLLPDGDRNVFTAGYGTAGGHWDLALMYLTAEKRTITNNRDLFNGTYDTDALLLGVTYNW